MLSSCPRRRRRSRAREKSVRRQPRLVDPELTASFKGLPNAGDRARSGRFKPGHAGVIEIRIALNGSVDVLLKPDNKLTGLNMPALLATLEAAPARAAVSKTFRCGDTSPVTPNRQRGSNGLIANALFKAALKGKAIVGGARLTVNKARNRALPRVLYFEHTESA